MFRFTKKRAVVLGAVASLTVGAVAFAFFTSTGSGTGSGSVGSSTAFTVAVSSDASGTLYPGAGTQVLTYTVTNPSAGYQNLASTVASVNADGAGNIVPATGTAAGCKAAWFTAVAASNATLPQNLAGAGTSSGTVTLTMQDSGTNQDPCQGKSPTVTVAAS